jgi:hypothetical protein
MKESSKYLKVDSARVIDNATKVTAIHTYASRYLWVAFTQPDVDESNEDNAHLMRLDIKDVDESSKTQYRINYVDSVMELEPMNDDDTIFMLCI